MFLERKIIIFKLEKIIINLKRKKKRKNPGSDSKFWVADPTVNSSSPLSVSALWVGCQNQQTLNSQRSGFGFKPHC
jgi:hypothetical protein